MNQQKDFLLEIGTEELPYSAQKVVLKEAENILCELIKNQNLAFENIKIFTTPTRIVGFVKNLAEKQAQKTDKVLGPKKEIAFKDNQPTNALFGFLKKNNADLDDLKEENTGKGIYVFVEKISETIQTKDLLNKISNDFVSKLPFSKMMIWNETNFKFIRPIRWIFSLFGDEKLNIEIAGIKNNGFTFGIGGFKTEKIEINTIDEYFEKLQKNEVILDYESRKQTIKNMLKNLTNEKDEDLLDEVTALVENPISVICEYSKDFLKLPEEVIYTVLKNHQKCFAIYDENKKLKPNFIGICNGKNKNFELVKQGFEKVAIARLNDAMFFYEKDLKIPLKDRTEKLKNLVYQEKLGSVYDKLERMKKIAGKIGSNEKIIRTIELCKNDLLTDMVYEFPELQGVMGRIYAEKTGDSDVANAIYEHYLPKFVGDDLPKTLEGAVVSITDKIDNIVSTFILGKKPTGSKDPFGIKRQIYGIFNILEEQKWDIDVFELIKMDDEKELHEFFIQRLENWLVDKGIRIDVARSVIFDKTKCEPNKIFEKAKFILQNLNNQDFLEVINLFKRANNISKDFDKNWEIQENLLEKQEEKLLFEYVKDFEFCSFDEFLENCLKSKNLIHNFFENVMVMDENINKKNNRLKILQILVDKILTFADLSEIVI